MENDAPIKSIPANLEAERAVLGSLLIDPDAIIKVANFLRVEDFFRERHGWLYDVMMTLHERREPLDFVTVVDELERRGQLEEIGGPAYITDLIGSTPTSINVDFYARIVERTALLRRLISAAGQIAELAYDEEQEVDEVIDRAETLIFGVSEARIHRDLMPIRAIMGNVVDRIDFLTRNKDTLMGVPTGFTMLDRLLGGMQKSDLIILAARPAMGKTSLAINVAQNAAKRYGARVAIFSLEMSNEQLAQRLLSMETGIDSHRLRLGQLHEDEWPILLEAANVLAGTNIFIDDTPAASVTEIRTKCRRLYAEHGLDMVLIDYMQLMSGQTGGRNENRQQEISYISRSLKSLARELNVPVIALSQLSRAVESRSDKRPMLSDLRESGCLAGDTPIYLPEQGIVVPISSLVGQTGTTVMSLDTDTWRHAPGVVTNAFCTGVKPVFRLETQLGRRVKATANHRFLTIDGWKRLDELSTGDLIAVPRTLAGPAEMTLSSEQLALLGGKEDVLEFAATIGTVGAYRQEGLRSIVSFVDSRTANTNRDVIPAQVWRKYAVPAMAQAHISSREMQAGIGMQYCGTTLYRQNLGRERAARLAQVVHCQELKHLANSDVYWDAVAAIEPSGEEPVYDLTVPRYHNFVAGNIVVHNSIEQDADVVLFIYRDDYYNEDSEQQNIADVIVAKHRHGSTGTVSLYFRKELTQFRDLEIQRTELDY